MKNRLIFFLPLLVFFANCGKAPNYLDVSSYYFPYDLLEEGLVYEYQSTGGDSLTTEYWFHKSVKDENGWQHTGNYYDQNLKVRQFYREQVFETGTIFKDYFLYVTDSTGKEERIDANIGSPNGFPFQLKDSTSILVTELSWLFSEEPFHKTSLVRNKQYAGKIKYRFKGEDKPAIQFSLKELIDDEREGHLEAEYNGLEIYAKDIGLVYYNKEISKDLQLQYQLVDIYPMAQLEEKFNKQYEVKE